VPTHVSRTPLLSLTCEWVRDWTTARRLERNGKRGRCAAVVTAHLICCVLGLPPEGRPLEANDSTASSRRRLKLQNVLQMGVDSNGSPRAGSQRPATASSPRTASRHVWQILCIPSGSGDTGKGLAWWLWPSSVERHQRGRLFVQPPGALTCVSPTCCWRCTLGQRRHLRHADTAGGALPLSHGLLTALTLHSPLAPAARCPAAAVPSEAFAVVGRRQPRPGRAWAVGRLQPTRFLASARPGRGRVQPRRCAVRFCGPHGPHPPSHHAAAKRLRCPWWFPGPDTAPRGAPLRRSARRDPTVRGLPRRMGAPPRSGCREAGGDPALPPQTAQTAPGPAPPPHPLPQLVVSPPPCATVQGVAAAIRRAADDRLSPAAATACAAALRRGAPRLLARRAPPSRPRSCRWGVPAGRWQAAGGVRPCRCACRGA